MQAQTHPANQRAIVELRYFRMRNGRQVERTTGYLRSGLLPAFERAGIRPVGCFNAVIAPDSPFILTLASYPSLAAFETSREKLATDKELLSAADEYNSMTELSYTRMENSLLWTFPSMPAVAVPPTGENRAARIFELRTYEAPNEKALARKIKMFGDGEIDIFRRSGMLTIFFGQTIVGSRMPNLTYMLAYDDLAARDKTWQTFSGDADWRKLRVTPGLSDADVVNNVSNAILRPLPFSPIR
jgi:hypothetical protein